MMRMSVDEKTYVRCAPHAFALFVDDTSNSGKALRHTDIKALQAV
jgi:hypothetical protein